MPKRRRAPRPKLPTDDDDREEAICRYLARGGSIKVYSAEGRLVDTLAEPFTDDSRAPGA